MSSVICILCVLLPLVYVVRVVCFLFVSIRCCCMHCVLWCCFPFGMPLSRPGLSREDSGSGSQQKHKRKCHQELLEVISGSFESLKASRFIVIFQFVFDLPMVGHLVHFGCPRGPKRVPMGIYLLWRYRWKCEHDTLARTGASF